MQKYHSRSTGAGACSKRWKHWKGCGAFELRRASFEMDITVARCAEEVSHYRRLAELFAAWMSDRVVPTVLDVTIYVFHEDCSQLWLVDQL